MIYPAIAGGLCLTVALWLALLYNRLTTLRNRWRNAFAQIDVQLARRHALIPSLVETVKGYARHEQATFEAVATARSAATAAVRAAEGRAGERDAMQQLGAAEAGLNQSLARLLRVVEAYPELKAGENTVRLMDELTTTENRIAFARQHFNDSVMHYNTARERVPANLVAALAGFREATLLEIREAERQVPSV